MKTTQKVSITADAACNMPAEMLLKNDIDVIHCCVKTKTGEFLESEEIFAENVIDYVKRHKQQPEFLPVTVEQYREFFAKKLETVNSICHFSISQKINRSYFNALEAAKSFVNVHIIDSKQVSAGVSFVALQGARLAKEGFDVPFIRRSTEELSGKIHTSFAARDTEFQRTVDNIGTIRADLLELCGLSPRATIVGGAMKKSYFHTNGYDYIEKYIKKELSIKNINTELLFFNCVNPLTIDTAAISAEIAKYVHFDKIVPVKISLPTASALGESAIGLSFITD